jgi:hypothetical protein
MTFENPTTGKFISLVLAWLCAGCDDPKTRLENVELNAEVKVLEHRLAEAKHKNRALEAKYMEAIEIASQAEAEMVLMRGRIDEFEESLHSDRLALLNERAEDANARFRAALSELKGNPAVSERPAPRPVVEEQEIDPLVGLPAEVVRIITSYAITEWPDSERMQKSTIENQATAWRTMDLYRRQAVRAIPYRVKTSMVAAALREWPQNFAMQVSQFEGNAAAWEVIEEWERTGIPGVPFRDRKEIIQAARDRWGDDHRMVLYEIRKKSGVQ